MSFVIGACEGSLWFDGSEIGADAAAGVEQDERRPLVGPISRSYT
jgi:hypothetical protein